MCTFLAKLFYILIILVIINRTFTFTYISRGSGRRLIWWSSWCTTMRKDVPFSEPTVKTRVQCCALVNLPWGGRDKQIPGSAGQAVSSSTVRHSLLKRKMGSTWWQTPEVDLGPAHAHMCTCTCPHMNTHTRWNRILINTTQVIRDLNRLPATSEWQLLDLWLHVHCF